MPRKITSKYFVEQLVLALNRNDPYLMGAKGQRPRDLKYGKGNWLIEQYKGDSSQYKRALLALQRSQADPDVRAWDCNGLIEGIYELATGDNINQRARDNYHDWCGTKGSGLPPVKYRLPGCCVFSSSSGKVSNITHVGYLWKPVDADRPSGDWWVIEARGVMYGVVKTRLGSRSWKWWGLCTRYIDYENVEVAEPVSYKLGERELAKGDDGDDVAELQGYLVALKYDVGKYGADGEFGAATMAAVRAFQHHSGLDEDGVYGPAIHAALVAALAKLDQPDVPDTPTSPADPTTPDASKGDVLIIGKSVNLRTGPSTQYAIADVLHEGDTLTLADAAGWVPVLVGGEVRWVSAKYAQVAEVNQ